MKSRCQVCDPSCTLEVRGYSTSAPISCPFNTGYSPEWKGVSAKKATVKKAKRVPALRAQAPKVEHTIAGFRLL